MPEKVCEDNFACSSHRTEDSIDVPVMARKRGSRGEGAHLTSRCESAPSQNQVAPKQVWPADVRGRSRNRADKIIELDEHLLVTLICECDRSGVEHMHTQSLLHSQICVCKYCTVPT